MFNNFFNIPVNSKYFNPNFHSHYFNKPEINAAKNV